ncbi:sigma-70 family RNA polymerase sigma factor [Aureisphaera sp. CAU 1614]|jgi:RNA polymerase sigma-70 factor (ECF subfamily)|uniref:Sigma-70 family RNA polymerase sigma factor n=1 Tax=Halomarinibacterium sedimenti TaxID=2857106 RepID=A0A9X1K059_9FLAO|nr:sigma-70 family RNA polymerase sigma factor [Halomarinibacterium sedimenti]MAL61253.1 RNA polymerase subunit sigma-70 [Flavobacteriaceae bacterium]MBW2938086.1 sigma-70 family RNA polymerase sigma factor [Halomarinibacterium sedimenti]HAT67157.1 RNA polymerase subunit sigma-70 [Flavobacteriaceae bacterium]|tara:strand:- start:581 stop:1087 length:507 start_codon:yes stop_codon:yes gene_type:complete
MNQTEFTALVLPFKDKLYRMAKRLLVSSEEAEDAVQEVFLKLWKGKQRITNYANPEAFAMTMTKNYCLDRLKSKQASNLKIVHSNYQNSENLQRTVEVNDGVSMVFKIMETLPEKQRMILQLRDVEQFEFHEISEMLDINETAIRVNLSRARKTVRDELLKKYNYGVS